MEETASKKFISIYGIPPDGGYGWTIVLVSFILRNIVDGIGYSSGYFVKPLQDEFKSSTLSAIALIFSLYFGMQNFMGPVTAIALNRLRETRKLTMICCAVAATSFAISSLISDIYLLWIFYGISAGIACGIIYSCSVYVILTYFTSRKTLAMGFSSTGSAFGMILTSPTLGFAAEFWTWRVALQIKGVLCMIAFLLAILYCPLAKDPILESEISFTNRTLKSICKMMLIDLKSLIANILFILFLVNNILGSYGFYIPSIYIVSRVEYLEEKEMVMKNFFATNASSTISNTTNDMNGFLSYKFQGEYERKYLLNLWLGLGSIAGRLISGYLGDLHGINRLWLLFAVNFIAGVSTVGSALLEKFWQIYIYLFIYGFCSGAIVVLSAIVTVDITGYDIALNALSLLSLAGGFGTIVGPPLTGYFHDERDQSFQSIFIRGGLIITLGAFLLVPIAFLKERKSNENTNYSLLVDEPENDLR